MKTLLKAALLMLVPCTAHAQVNAGTLKPEAELPFTMTQVADFQFSPGVSPSCPMARMLVTERVGSNVAGHAAGSEDFCGERTRGPVLWGQTGMLGVYMSPDYATY